MKSDIYYNENGFLEIAIPPCEFCDGHCCRQNGHEFAVMLEDGEENRFQDAIQFPDLVNGPDWVLPYKQGKCVYLTDNNRCGIYNTRPSACRKFKCTNGYNRDPRRHSFFVRDNSYVAELIQVRIIGR